MIILSILIPSIPEHVHLLEKLKSELHTQIITLHAVHPTLGRVEVLINDSIRYLDGGLSIGKKREALVKQAEGRYVAFCDCDDWIAPNYIESLVRLCHHGRDIVTFRNITRLDSYWMLVDMSLNYQNDQANPNITVRRKPWTICPVRKEFAKMFPFPDTNYSEDSEWMDKVLTMCTTEAHTEQILHEYRHSKLTSEADKITAHVQSIK